MADIAIAVVVCVFVIAMFLWSLFGKHSSTSTKAHTTHTKHTTSDPATRHLGRITHTLKNLEKSYRKGTEEYKEALKRRTGYKSAMIASFRKNGMSESDILRQVRKYFGND